MWGICACDTVWVCWRKTDGTPSENEVESLLCDAEDAESDNLPEEEAEAKPHSVHRSICWKWLLPGWRQAATFMIMRSRGGSVAREVTHLLDQSMLCLACRVVNLILKLLLIFGKNINQELYISKRFWTPWLLLLRFLHI